LLGQRQEVSDKIKDVQLTKSRSISIVIDVGTLVITGILHKMVAVEIDRLCSDLAAIRSSK
jgi:hypothetical protein